jgi:polysaccharide biosynthesis protein PslH
MKKMLVVSPYVPYDTVGHAGGKTHNYYLKYFQQSDDLKVKLISFCYENDEGKIDLNQYGVDHTLFTNQLSLKEKLFRKIINIQSRITQFDQYAGIVTNYEVFKVISLMKQMKKEGYYPDVILLEWTQMVVLAPKIKEIYPQSKIIASEHDVTFLGYERMYEYEKNTYEKQIKKNKFIKIKKLELDVLKNSCDLVVTHNEKDMELLLENGVTKEKLHVIAPFFMDMTNIHRNVTTKDIIYFGAMSRPENYLSAIWFIENVLDKISDNEVRFIVIGGNPHPSLLKYASDRVIIAGFVEDVAPYFSNCLCAAAPLVLGAGIKVKILETLSAGVPTLTNDIGIEGIPAKDGVHYLYCTDPNDYIETIHKILNGSIDLDILTENMRNFMKEKFNLEHSAENYLERINKKLQND